MGYTSLLVIMRHEPPARLDFAIDVDFDRILTNPILDIAARVWDDDRYRAFQLCYRSMRRIDDLVDDRRATGQQITSEEARSYARMLTDWLDSLRRGERGDGFMAELGETIDRFSIPLWPWERLCRAMAYDLNHNGFASFPEFLRYTEGAAIAPAAIFMHLCGVSQKTGQTMQPEYDIRKAARPLALFSYLVHIMRDFQKDQEESLNYFPQSVLNRFNLTVDEMRIMASSGRPNASLRQLFELYARLADRYRQNARKMIDDLRPKLENRYAFSLELIYQLYLQIFEMVDPAKGSFTQIEFQPEPEAVRARIERTVAEFAQ